MTARIAKMMPILAPASRNGSEFGSLIFQKTCSWRGTSASAIA
jgi:hypothetical protein